MGEETRAMLGEIDDLRDEVKRLQAENENLRAELTEWQCGSITLEEYESEIRPT